MMSMIATVMFFPGFTELLAVCVIAVIVLVTVIINVLFHLHRLRNMFLESLIQGFLNDPDVRKIIDHRVRGEEFRKRIKQILKEQREKKISKAKNEKAS